MIFDKISIVLALVIIALAALLINKSNFALCSGIIMMSVSFIISALRLLRLQEYIEYLKENNKKLREEKVQHLCEQIVSNGESKDELS